jgi:hypothetical protein
MGHYVFRVFDPVTKVADMIERDFPEALNALDAARNLATDCAVEVWDDFGRIARVKKGDALSTHSYRSQDKARHPNQPKRSSGMNEGLQ